MAIAESLFCRLLKTNFEQLEVETETLLAIPILLLRKFKSLIQTYDRIVLSNAEKILDELSEKLLEYAMINEIVNNEYVKDWCSVLYKCRALKNFLSTQFPTINLMQYNEFEKKVCVIGLKDIINSALDKYYISMMDSVEGKLTILQNQIDDYEARIHNAELKYIDFLNRSGIYQKMLKYDEYLECAFATCNWAATASNKKEDIEDRLYAIQNPSPNIALNPPNYWIPNMSPLYDKQYKRGSFIKQTINQLGNDVGDVKERKKLNTVKKSDVTQG